MIWSGSELDEICISYDPEAHSKCQIIRTADRTLRSFANQAFTKYTIRWANITEVI